MRAGPRSGHGSGGDGLSRCDVPERRDGSVGAAVSNGVVAFPCVAGAIGSDAVDLRLRRDLVQQVGSHRGIEGVASGDLRGRTSRVSYSIPRWVLRQIRRFGPPCLRACRAPSPAMPVLSMGRFSGPCPVQAGGPRLTFDAPCRLALHHCRPGHGSRLQGRVHDAGTRGVGGGIARYRPAPAVPRRREVAC